MQPNHRFRGTRVASALLAFAASSLIAAEDRVTTLPNGKLIIQTLDTGIEEQPELVMVLRLPKDHTPENPTAKGVVLYSTYMREVESLKTLLANDGAAPVRYALANGYAVITWGTKRLWKTGVNQKDLDRRQWQEMDRDFDRVARICERGIGRFCKEYGIPE